MRPCVPQVKGRNRQGCPVFFVGDIDELKGQLVPVRITEAGSYFLVGEREANKVNPVESLVVQ